MKLKELFTKKSKEAALAEQVQLIAPCEKLDLDALDDCAGGRAETDGVGCYTHSTRSNVH